MKLMFTISFFMLTAPFLCPAKQVVDTPPKAPDLQVQIVDFLTAAPVIDGVLDPQLKTLPVRQFNTIHHDGVDTPVPASYRLAYGMEFFYVYIEARADHLTFRDRAYQNGDGFLVLIARPRPGGEAADEFYELACSAVDVPEREWQRHIFWNYNVNQLFVPVSPDTHMEFRAGGGKISFELLLPWAGVRPYHPWLSGEIGFNLSFCKAVEPAGSTWYQVLEDDAGAEFQKRRYLPLRFEPPAVSGPPQTFVSIREGHITEGQSLTGVAVTAASRPVTENLSIAAGTGESPPETKVITYDCKAGLTRHEFSIDSRQLPADASLIRWESHCRNKPGSYGLSVLPRFDEAGLNHQLKGNGGRLARSSLSTLQFLIRELRDRLDALKVYETCPRIRTDLFRLLQMTGTAGTGRDPLAGLTGFIRKAYRSKIDGTLQPYLIYLPGNYDRRRTYPLMVFLHGSASDETNLQRFDSLIPGGFIAVGPLGRGKSNGYSRDHAQDDIAEVIGTVAGDYSIDTSRILLAGFSMGGYGVYRTFHETPARYRALAIFSGGPDLGHHYAPRTLAPDFTREENLRSFRHIPVFIFHGEKDLNVPLPVTRELTLKLKQAGALVELHTDPARGHQQPGPQTVEAYLQWVKKVLE